MKRKAGGNILTLEDLRALESWTAAQIGAAFVAALGIPEQDLCLKCFTGVSPLD